MSNILYSLFCDWCNWRRIVRDEKETVDLYEMKTSDVQKTTDKLVNGEFVAATFEKQKRKFRCPDCGRYCSPKMVPDVQQNLDDKIELEKRVKERKENEKNWFGGCESGPKRREIP